MTAPFFQPSCARIKMLHEALRLACRGSGACWNAASGLSELRHSLKMANHPAIRSWRHEHNEMRYDVFLVYQFSTVQNLKLILGRVVQLYHIALWSIKHGLHFVILIDVPLAEARALLACDALAK